MATLFEIDQAILSCIDTETGEILDIDRLNALQMERGKKIESVALWIKNLEADVMGYKWQKDAFAEREKAAKNKIESLKKWLTVALDGQKMATDKVAISFRKSESVEIESEDEFMGWADFMERDDLLKYGKPSPDKTAIKNAIKNGQNVFGCAVVEKLNAQIK